MEGIRLKERLDEIGHMSGSNSDQWSSFAKNCAVTDYLPLWDFALQSTKIKATILSVIGMAKTAWRLREKVGGTISTPAIT